MEKDKKRRRKRTLTVISAILVLVIAAATVFASLVRSKVILFNRFFILPSYVKGVDVARFQGEIDFSRLAEQGIEFVYIKATEGTAFTDDGFVSNWKNAEESGLIAGAYHFFSFDSPGKTQAENYIKTVGSLEGRLIPAVDVEMYRARMGDPPAKEDVVRELRVFMDAIFGEYGVYPVLYSTRSFYADYLKDDFSSCPRWVRNIYYPVWVEVGDGWTVWQYCDRGMLEGYDGVEIYIDLDVIKDRNTFENMKYDNIGK